jgi:hypothetical protein
MSPSHELRYDDDTIRTCTAGRSGTIVETRRTGSARAKHYGVHTCLSCNRASAITEIRRPTGRAEDGSDNSHDSRPATGEPHATDDGYITSSGYSTCATGARSAISAAASSRTAFTDTQGPDTGIASGRTVIGSRRTARPTCPDGHRL